MTSEDDTEYLLVSGRNQDRPITAGEQAQRLRSAGMRDDVHLDRQAESQRVAR